MPSRYLIIPLAFVVLPVFEAASQKRKNRPSDNDTIVVLFVTTVSSQRFILLGSQDLRGQVPVGNALHPQHLRGQFPVENRGTRGSFCMQRTTLESALICPRC